MLSVRPQQGTLSHRFEESTGNGNEEIHLLQYMREDPDDLDRRLVYADWLDDQGDSQADFVRIQCQNAAAPRTLDAIRLRQRAAELYRIDRPKWDRRLLATLNQSGLESFDGRPSRFNWQYRRGCVERVEFFSHDLENHLESTLLIGPVTDLRIIKPGKKMKPFHVEHLKMAKSLQEFWSIDLSEIPNGIRIANFIGKSRHLFANLRSVRFAVGRIAMRGVSYWDRDGSKRTRRSLEDIATKLFRLPKIEKVEFKAIGKIQVFTREELSK